VSTITDPHRNLLEAVIATDHLELGGVLVELGRLPETPQVIDQLVADMDRRARVHMAVVERVLLPALVVGEREEIVEEVLSNHDRVRHDLDGMVAPDNGLAAAVRDLEVDLADQVAFEDGVLVPAIEEELDERAVEGLAFRYSKLADTGVTTPAPPH
jgi:hypothetical protein